MKKQLILVLFTFTRLVFADSPGITRNKLLEMFRFFYLPFKIDFHEGATQDEIIPSMPRVGFEEDVVITPEEMQKLEKRWTQLRLEWRTKSLLNDTKVEINGNAIISSHLISHRIAATRSALDSLPLEDRIRIRQLLRGKSKEVQAAVLQKQFVRSFIDPKTVNKAHFFIVAPNWCASSENYRTVIETYAKKLAMGDFVLHSIIIEDPKEEIFDTKAMNELFPFAQRYSQESVPRFLLAEERNGEFTILEEGAALHSLYENHFAKFQGFLNSENPLQKNALADRVSPSLSRILVR